MLSQILLIACLVANSQVTAQQCQVKDPVNGFKTEYLQGTMYLVAMKTAFDYQSSENKCTTTNIPSPSSNGPFAYMVMGDGGQSIANLTLTEKTPGVYDVDGVDPKFTASLIGHGMNKFLVWSGCNPQTGDYALWLYTRQRFDGVDNVDQDIKVQVRQALEKNGFKMSDLKDIDNKSCT